MPRIFIQHFNRRITVWLGCLTWLVLCSMGFAQESASLHLDQGMMVGEVSAASALLQTRLTSGKELDASGDLPGTSGWVQFEWSANAEFSPSQLADPQFASADRDFIVRRALTGLSPGATYHYRVRFGNGEDSLDRISTAGSFQTLPGAGSETTSHFIVGSCMNYIKFMHGRAGNAGGPLTATREDKTLGFPAFATMAKLQPDFFVGTGDIVYYDNPFRVSKTVPELRKCWHEQFRFPRMIDFFRRVPCYWSKDDHDFRYNDSDNQTDRTPLPTTGINLFREQLPIAVADDSESPNYRTHRVNREVQIWLTEGRDHRSPNRSPDGPDKTMWGEEQLRWLKETLTTSDARWKIMINPTPMVGPDDGSKKDNHANLLGFRHEADAFFDWVREQGLQDQVVLICGDRHWQYHSIHPCGVHEFACGALNDENARMGVPPGDPEGSDSEATVRQLFTSPEPSGGFLEVEAGMSLTLRHRTDDGKELYTVTFR